MRHRLRLCPAWFLSSSGMGKYLKHHAQSQSSLSVLLKRTYIEVLSPGTRRQWDSGSHESMRPVPHVHIEH